MAKKIDPGNDPFYDMRGDGNIFGEDVFDTRSKPAAKQAAKSAQTSTQYTATHRNVTIQPSGSKPGSALCKLFGLLGFLSFVGIFVTIFLTNFLGWDDPVWVMISLFGSTFCFVGLAVFCSKDSGGKIMGSIFALLGAVIAAVGLVLGLGPDWLVEVVMNKLVPVGAISLFILIGLALVIGPSIYASSKSKKYTVEVRSKVLEKITFRSRDSDGHMRTLYKLRWEYYQNGERYEYLSNIARRPEPRDRGDEGVLYLNPEDPKDVYEKMDAKSGMIVRVIGGMFALMGGFALVMFFLNDMF